jgi:hypothetical protein
MTKGVRSYFRVSEIIVVKELQIARTIRTTPFDLAFNRMAPSRESPCCADRLLKGQRRCPYDEARFVAKFCDFVAKVSDFNEVRFWRRGRDIGYWRRLRVQQAGGEESQQKSSSHGRDHGFAATIENRAFQALNACRMRVIRVL